MSASSGSLAFTGTGPGIGILSILGALLIVMGFVLFVLVDAPRLVLANVVQLGSARGRELKEMSSRLTQRLASWFLGR